MTIIQHTGRKSSYTIPILAIVFVFMAISVLAMYFYTRNAVLRADIRKGNEEIKKIRAENSEVENKISQILDSRQLEQMAGQLQLVKDTKPEYVPVSAQWPSVSHL